MLLLVQKLLLVLQSPGPRLLLQKLRVGPGLDSAARVPAMGMARPEVKPLPEDGGAHDD